jgi:hypothetical protein
MSNNATTSNALRAAGTYAAGQAPSVVAPSAVAPATAPKPGAMASGATPGTSSGKTKPSVNDRIAALMLAEQEAKARRDKIYQRWKIGGVIFLALLFLWFALTMVTSLHRP